MSTISEASLAASRSLKVRPLSPGFGAVVEDVQTTGCLAPNVVDELKSLLMDYKVLFFLEQKLTYEEQEAFAAQFGPPREDPLEHTIDGHPGLALIDSVPWFHSDWMSQEFPTKWSMLQMNSVPEVGGDTMFADLVASYEALSPALREFLERLTVYQCMAHFEGDGSAVARSYLNGIRERFQGDEDLSTVHHESESDFSRALEHVQPHSHPLVRYVPETGRKNYWISRTFSRKINELSAAESEMLLEYLFRHQIEPQFVLRWKWHPGDIAFWDHRTTVHSGIKDFGDFKRHGCRASIAGERVIPAWEA